MPHKLVLEDAFASSLNTLLFFHCQNNTSCLNNLITPLRGLILNSLAVLFLLSKRMRRLYRNSGILRNGFSKNPSFPEEKTFF